MKEKNVIKGNTYNQLIKRYDKAKEFGFYFEALAIEYAMIEDRIKSLLYYLGVILKRDARCTDCQKTKKLICEICNRENNKSKISIDNLCSKISIVRSMINWYKKDVQTNEKYLIELKKCFDKLDCNDLLLCFDDIENWKDYRNTLTHSLMNQELDILYESIEDRIEEGFIYARIIDTWVRKLKGKHNLRNAMKMD